MPPIVIVGATGGVGRALAHRLARQGKQLHLVGRNKAELTALTQSINQSMSQDNDHSNNLSTMSVGDVLDPKSMEAAIQEAALHQYQSSNESNKQSSKGELAGLAYCVGSIDLKPFHSLKQSADMLPSFQLNVLGAVDVLRAAYQPLMNYSINRSSDTHEINQHYPPTSSVLLFSSIAARQGFANHAIVATSKAAIEGLTRSLAAEWAPHIRVNAIAPTLTQSKMSAKYFMGKPANDKSSNHVNTPTMNPMLESVLATHPLRRLGMPDDIAPLAALLLTQDAGMITGQIMAVDAGKSTLNAKPDAKTH